MRGFLVRRRWVGAVVLAAAALVALAVVLSAGGGSEEPAPEQGGEATTIREGGSGRGLADSVILAGFEGAKPSRDLLAGLEKRSFGGLLVGPTNWRGAGPGRKLIAALRSAAPGSAPPPLIATVQEGGPYRALDDLPPSQREIEIGDRGDPKLAERWGYESASALRSVGIDLDLAPVADVATLDSPIADRAFSDDAIVAAQMTAAAIAGCRRAGIACAPSHFPGLGAAGQDTDVGPTSVGLDPATLLARDVVPFRAAFAAGAPAVVTSHAFYAADPVTPGTLSRAIVTGLLRDELGFRGVVISDDIGAGAITAISPPGDAAVRALAAGVDLIQVADPKDVEPVRRAIGAALADGTLSAGRLRAAAGRVMALRRRLAGPRTNPSGSPGAPSESKGASP